MSVTSSAFDYYSYVLKRFKEQRVMEISGPVILQKSKMLCFNLQRKHSSFSHLCVT